MTFTTGFSGGTESSQTLRWREMDSNCGPAAMANSVGTTLHLIRRGMTTVDTSAAEPEIRWHGPFGRVSLRQHSCASSALEAAGRQPAARLHVFILPQP